MDRHNPKTSCERELARWPIEQQPTVRGFTSLHAACETIARRLAIGQPAAFVANGCGSALTVLIAPASTARVTSFPVNTRPFVAVSCGSYGGMHQLAVFPGASDVRYLMEKLNLLEGDAATVGFLLDEIGERWQQLAPTAAEAAA